MKLRHNDGYRKLSATTSTTRTSDEDDDDDDDDDEVNALRRKGFLSRRLANDKG